MSTINKLLENNSNDFYLVKNTSSLSEVEVKVGKIYMSINFIYDFNHLILNTIKEKNPFLDIFKT